MKLLLLTSLLAFSSVAAKEATEISLNGSFVQGSGTVLNSTFQYDGVESKWQEHYIGDFLYKKFDGTVVHTNADLGVKLDYNLADTYYLQGGVRGEYDNLKNDTYSATTEFGIGVRLVHTSKVRLSDEIGVGVHSQRFGEVPVASNSLWFTWKIDNNLVFSNKFLIERGLHRNYLNTTYYTSNITALSYKLSPTLDLSIQQKYKKEPDIVTNITLLGLALHF
jgi:putative salt-induced outer membrane protein YdiY